MRDADFKKFLDTTIQAWQSDYPTPLTEEDARNIVDNITQLLNLLNELDKKYCGGPSHAPL